LAAVSGALLPGLTGLTRLLLLLLLFLLLIGLLTLLTLLTCLALLGLLLLLTLLVLLFRLIGHFKTPKYTTRAVIDPRNSHRILSGCSCSRQQDPCRSR
jgi:hypothetical protein